MSSKKQLNKQKRIKGKGLIGDVLGHIGKSAYYIGSKLIDPTNDLSYGEIHQPKLTGNFVKPITFSQTSGPGTKIFERIKQGKLGNDFIEKTSQKHDLLYALNQSGDFKKTQQADQNMLDNLSKNMSIWHPIDSLNAAVSYAGIKGKMIGENIFGQQYSGQQKLTDEEKQLAKKHLKQLELEGYGKKRKNEKRKKGNKGKK